MAQAPGGVSTNLTLWLKADNSATLIGNPVQSWSSSGGSAGAYGLTQNNLANRPALINGATNASKFNFNPRLKFSIAATTRLFNTSTSPDLMGSDGTAIVVTSNELGTIFTYTSGTTGRYQLKPNFRFQTGNTGTGYTFDWTAPTEYSTTSAFFPCSYGCGATMSLRKNSVQVNGANNSNLPLYYPSIVTGMYLGANNSGEWSDASVAEVILFDAKPSLAEMDRIESYLALKYGITRGGNTLTTPLYNYVASNGTTLTWDKTLNQNYNFDIAGIGRDDNSALNQKQSISVNNGEALTIALGNVAIPTENNSNSASFAADNSFLVWGNNGLAKSFNATATKPGGIQDRLDRIWKMQATNFAQAVSIGFENAQLLGLGALSNLCLLFDDDGNFADATVLAACQAINPSGTRIEFTGISIPAGKPFFTLAQVVVPTIISNNSPICPGATLVLSSQVIANAGYSWNGPNLFSSILAIDSIQNASAAATGTYTVTITNYGCITTLSTTANITASQVASVSISQTQGSNPMCSGAAASFTATAINGGSAPLFQWQVNGINTASGPSFTTSSLSNNDIVTVQLTSNALCVATSNVSALPIQITVNPPVLPIITISSDKTSICAGETVNFTAVAINGGSSPVYNWLVNGATTGVVAQSFSSSTLNNVDIVSATLTSSEACAQPQTVPSNSISISVTPQPKAAFSFSPPFPNETEPLVTFENISLNASSWIWDFGSNLAGSTMENPDFLFPAVGDYLVTLIALNGSCSDTAKNTITIEAFTAFYIPNTFSPNDDDLNDAFGIQGSGILAEEFLMQIYNRWGELIFETVNPSTKWEGKSINGLQVPTGVYVYNIEFRLKNQSEKKKAKGHLTLFR